MVRKNNLIFDLRNRIYFRHVKLFKYIPFLVFIIIIVSYFLRNFILLGFGLIIFFVSFGFMLNQKIILNEIDGVILND